LTAHKNNLLGQHQVCGEFRGQLPNAQSLKSKALMFKKGSSFRVFFVLSLFLTLVKKVGKKPILKRDVSPRGNLIIKDFI